MAAVILFILWSVLSKIMNDQLFRPIEELERHIGAQLDDADPVDVAVARQGPEEIRRLRTTFDDLLGRAKASFALEKKILASETKERIARQVAHDIRSPLSALNMVFARFDQLGDEGRALAKKAVQTHQRHRQRPAARQPAGSGERRPGGRAVLLESEIDGVVSETRAVFANRPGLEIVFEQRTYPRCFVTLRTGRTQARAFQSDHQFGRGPARRGRQRRDQNRAVGRPGPGQRRRRRRGESRPSVWRWSGAADTRSARPAKAGRAWASATPWTSPAAPVAICDFSPNWAAARR